MIEGFGARLTAARLLQAFRGQQSEDWTLIPFG
jgi:hypothetical protein